MYEKGNGTAPPEDGVNLAEVPFAPPADWVEEPSDGPQRASLPNVDHKLLQRLKLLSDADIKTIPSLAWLIDKVLPADALSELFGPPDGGKSFVAMDWALSIAEGIPWLDHKTKQGTVIYLYSEGQRGLRQRHRAWGIEHNREVIPNFYALPRAIDILNPGQCATLAQLIINANLQPMLIVIDTLARNFGTGDENSTKDMNAFVNGCESLREFFPGTAVLIVHHSGKDETKGGRGSIALHGAVETMFMLKKTPGKKFYPLLINNRQKDSDTLPPLSLYLAKIDIGRGESSLAVQKSDIEVSEETVPASVYQVLCELENATYTELREASGLKERTFNRRLKTAKEAGTVEQRGDRYYPVTTQPEVTDLSRVGRDPILNQKRRGNQIPADQRV